MDLRFGLMMIPLLASCTPGDPAVVPWMGEQRAVLVLIEWADEPATMPSESFEQAFFAEDHSLADYLREGSQTACVLTGDVVDWRTADERWQDLDHDDPAVVLEIARDLFSDALVPRRYDADGNGRIDNLFVLHSGRTELNRPSPRHLFPDGRADFSIVMQSQGVGDVGDEPALGIYVHEAGHRYLEQPDLYGEYMKGDYGIGIWGAMGLGGWGPNSWVPEAELYRYPTHLRASAREKVGWISIPRQEEDVTGLRLDPIELGGEALRIPGPGIDLVLEVRSQAGFSMGLPGQGLLVWREDGMDIDRPRVELVQADGRDDLSNGTPVGERPLPPIDANFGDGSDPFPGTENVTEYEDLEIGVRLENIHMDGDSVVLDVRFIGDEP